MFVALFIVGGAALSLSLFSLELQTAARAHVIDPVQLLNFQVAQQPVTVPALRQHNLELSRKSMRPLRTNVRCWLARPESEATRTRFRR